MHALLPLAPPQLSQPIGVSADALDAAFLSTGDSSPRGSLSLAALGAPPGCFGACNNAGECKEGVCRFQLDVRPSRPSTQLLVLAQSPGCSQIMPAASHASVHDWPCLSVESGEGSF